SLAVGGGKGKRRAGVGARRPRGWVAGVDPAPDMIRFATQQFAPAGRTNLRFAVADVRRLPFRGEFDRVVSFNALHWVPEQDAALRSLRAALVSAGQALLRFVPEGRRKCLEDVIEDVRQSARWAGHFTSFHKPYVHLTPEEFHDLASRNRLRVVRMELEDRAWDFQTREDFAAFGRATFVEWTRSLPESDWPAFIGEVLDCYRTVAADNP